MTDLDFDRLFAAISVETPIVDIERDLGHPMHVLLDAATETFELRRRYANALFACAMRIDARADVAMNSTVTVKKGTRIGLWRVGQHERCKARDLRRQALQLTKRWQNAKTITRPSATAIKATAQAHHRAAGPRFFADVHAERMGIVRATAPQAVPPPPRSYTADEIDCLQEIGADRNCLPVARAPLAAPSGNAEQAPSKGSKPPSQPTHQFPILKTPPRLSPEGLATNGGTATPAPLRAPLPAPEAPAAPAKQPSILGDVPVMVGAVICPTKAEWARMSRAGRDQFLQRCSDNGITRAMIVAAVQKASKRAKVPV